MMIRFQLVLLLETILLSHWCLRICEQFSQDKTDPVPLNAMLDGSSNRKEVFGRWRNSNNDFDASIPS